MVRTILGRGNMACFPELFFWRVHSGISEKVNQLGCTTLRCTKWVNVLRLIFRINGGYWVSQVNQQSWVQINRSRPGKKVHCLVNEGRRNEQRKLLAWSQLANFRINISCNNSQTECACSWFCTRSDQIQRKKNIASVELEMFGQDSLVFFLKKISHSHSTVCNASYVNVRSIWLKYIYSTNGCRSQTQIVFRDKGLEQQFFLNNMNGKSQKRTFYRNFRKIKIFLAGNL